MSEIITIRVVLLAYLKCLTSVAEWAYFQREEARLAHIRVSLVWWTSVVKGALVIYVFELLDSKTCRIPHNVFVHRLWVLVQRTYIIRIENPTSPNL